MTEKAQIFYKDIGDYLSREEKLRLVTEGRSILNPALNMTELQPNEHGDWINKRNSKFDEFIPIEPEKKFDVKPQSFFSTYAIGVATNRDPWVYNYSKSALIKNMKRMIDFYNGQSIAYNKLGKTDKKAIDFVDDDPEKISWTRSLRKDVENNVFHKLEAEKIQTSLYRPFSTQYLYYDKPFIESPCIWSQLFPTTDSQNILICVTGIASTKPFSAIITNIIPCLDLVDKSQCFPRYWYAKKPQLQDNLFHQPEDEYIRRDAISDFILDQSQTRYGPRVTKEDIFYYVYGILHSPDYRTTFANDLKKMLPRLPLVEKPADFWAFSEAGRKLADLHLNYEDQETLSEITVSGADKNQFTVAKMTFPSKERKDTILYNSQITIYNIPDKAYQYIVNGKSAIEWVMERYAVTVHKESGITNDPNDWAAEHGNPRYILDLLLSVITVSVKTVDIVAELPNVEWE